MTPFEGKRQPAVAGLFYPSDKDDLYETIHRSFTSDLGPGEFPSKNRPRQAGGIDSKNADCLIVPHAGYAYSGAVAAHSYLKAYDFLSSSNASSVSAIILGPNHYGIGSGVALSPRQSWETPLGDVPIDETLSLAVSKGSEIVDLDQLAHSREHSVEVQIPFLQVISKLAEKKLSIVPICLMLQDRETAEQVSKAVLSVIRKVEEGTCLLIIGSSDLTHYEPQKRAFSKDTKLLDSVSQLEILEFYKTLERLNITACGYGPIATVMYLAKGLGLRRGNIMKYATSGDVTGDKSSVVGYSSVQFL